MPNFAWVADTNAAEVIINAFGGLNDQYCGKERSDGKGINLYVLGTSECHVANSYHGAIPTIVAHELVTILGWKDGVEQYGVTGVSSQSCVSTFPSSTPGPLSTQICYHDVNGLAQLYRLGNVNLGTPSEYWGTKILAQSDVALASDSVVQGDSTVIQASLLTVGPPYAEYTASVGYGASSYAESFGTSGIASRSGNFIKGNAVGSVMLTFKATTASAGFSLWDPLVSKGVTQSLQVTNPPPPPPPPPFKADSISTAAVPIAVGGLTRFDAHVSNGPSQPLLLRWIVADSRTPTVADTVWTHAQSYLNWSVALADSYTLTIKLRPRDELLSQWGIAVTQDFPVCTGGENLLAGGESGKHAKEPPGTDAVEGCAPPGGGEY